MKIMIIQQTSILTLLRHMFAVDRIDRSITGRGTIRLLFPDLLVFILLDMSTLVEQTIPKEDEDRDDDDIATAEITLYRVLLT